MNSASAARHNDPSSRWRLYHPVSQGVALDREFIGDAILERARPPCCSAMSQLNVELLAKGLSHLRCSVLVLLIDDILQKCRT